MFLFLLITLHRVEIVCLFVFNISKYFPPFCPLFCTFFEKYGRKNRSMYGCEVICPNSVAVGIPDTAIIRLDTIPFSGCNDVERNNDVFVGTFEAVGP